MNVRTKFPFIEWKDVGHLLSQKTNSGHVFSKVHLNPIYLKPNVFNLLQVLDAAVITFIPTSDYQNIVDIQLSLRLMCFYHNLSVSMVIIITSDYELHYHFCFKWGPFIFFVQILYFPIVLWEATTPKLPFWIFVSMPDVIHFCFIIERVQWIAL